MTSTLEETLKAGISKEANNTTELPPSSMGRSLGFGFSSYRPKEVPILPKGFEDYVKLIEASRNFSTAYSLAHSPKEDMLEDRIESVIFKVSESQLHQTATYHFWKNVHSNPVFYVITVSTKDRQIDAVVYKNIDSLSVKFFKITEQNTVDIIEYSAPGM